MADHNTVTIRISPAVKAQLLTKARRRNKTPSRYIEELVKADKEPVEPEKREAITEPIPLTEEERKVLERFVGMYGRRSKKKGTVHLTNEEIDKVVYGEH